MQSIEYHESYAEVKVSRLGAVPSLNTARCNSFFTCVLPLFAFQFFIPANLSNVYLSQTSSQHLLFFIAAVAYFLVSFFDLSTFVALQFNTMVSPRRWKTTHLSISILIQFPSTACHPKSECAAEQKFIVRFLGTRWQHSKVNQQLHSTRTERLGEISRNCSKEQHPRSSCCTDQSLEGRVAVWWSSCWLANHSKWKQRKYYFNERNHNGL